MLGKFTTTCTLGVKRNLYIMYKPLLAALITSVLILLILLVSSLNVSAETSPDGFDYKVINENEIRINDYTGAFTEVAIPETIDGKPVTTIYELNSVNVTKITIPKTVKTIYGAAFRNMPNLIEICFEDFSEGFVVIGPSAFPDSTQRISFPENMTDRDIQKKMTLEVFPIGAVLYSGAEPLPHDYVYTPVNGGTQHYQQCTACGSIKADSYEDHVFEGDFFIDPSFNNETHHYQYCKCGTSHGRLHVWENGVCTVCNAKDPNYIPPTETEPTETSPTETEPTPTETVTEDTTESPTATEPTVTVPTVTSPTGTAPSAPSRPYYLVPAVTDASVTTATSAEEIIHDSSTDFYTGEDVSVDAAAYSDGEELEGRARSAAFVYVIILAGAAFVVKIRCAKK